jgi:NAD(P)H dehydrogenase (quinone)
MKQVLIINGHPDKQSYNYALSEAYLKGTSKTDAIMTQINIADLDFNPNLEFGYRKRTELESDLL